MENVFAGQREGRGRGEISPVDGSGFNGPVLLDLETITLILGHSKPKNGAILLFRHSPDNFAYLRHSVACK